MWVPSSVSAPGMPVLAASSLSTHLPLCQTLTDSGDASLTETQVKPLPAPFSGFTSPSITACISSFQTTGPATPSTSSPFAFLEGHQRAFDQHFFFALPQFLQAGRGVAPARREVALRRFRGRRGDLRFRRLRDFFAAELVRQVAEFGEHLLQARFRAGRDFPGDLGGVLGRAVGLDDVRTLPAARPSGRWPAGRRSRPGRTSACAAFGCVHLPSTSGESFGSSEPRIFFTGFEKVSSIGVEAEIVMPAAGRGGDDRRAGRREPGDGLRPCRGAPSDCGAQATSIWPADGCSPRVTELRGWSKRRCFISPSGP